MLTRIATFLKSHIVGIIVVGICTSLAASYLYAWWNPPGALLTQQIDGNQNVQIGTIKDARDVTINSAPKMRKRDVLRNPGSPVALVLKELGDEPDIVGAYALKPEMHLGLIPVGTEVRVLPEKRHGTKGPVRASYTKVELLEGDYKGQVGWVSINNFESQTVAEPNP